MNKPVAIGAIMVGKAVPFGRPGAVSAIDKGPLDGPVELTTLGFIGDEQGDRRHHGGPDKAVHHYAFDHYDRWRRELHPVPEVLAAAGAFGENVSTLGMTEDDVCAGDIYRLGGATLQVSQARQPCWKLNHRFGVKDMARRVQASGRTGWYYRVLEPGLVNRGDALILLDRPFAGWTLSRILRALYVDMLDMETLAGIAAIEPLAPSWRTLATRRLETGRVEDWAKRLGEVAEPIDGAAR